MNKSEQILKRQKALFDYIDTFTGTFFKSDTTILDALREHYGDCNSRTVRRDIDELTDKFLIHKSYKWINDKSLRICTVVNKTKDLRYQSDSNYLEAMVLANPDCFRIKWTIGYDKDQGGIKKYVDTLEDRKGVTCTGVFLLKNPNKMLSNRPVRYKNLFIKDIESMGSNKYDDAPLPF